METLKKKIKLIMCIVVVLIILFAPFNIQRYKDGGTATYTALSYKLIVWHQLDDSIDGYKAGTEIHFFPNNFHNLDYYTR
jgi:hypothetical protein